MVCPKGHDSEDSDFCSVCGVKMAALQVSVGPPAAPMQCPDCGAARHSDDAVFCEDCGFNFSSGAHGESKVTSVVPEPQAPILTEWEVAIAIDPALKTADSPEPPADFQPSTKMLMGESHLIGRRSDKRGIFPDISLDSDDAVSHRHALLNRTADGGIVLRDVGSSNGTRLNGVDVTPLTDIALNDGDAVTVGHWTRLTLKRVS